MFRAQEIIQYDRDEKRWQIVEKDTNQLSSRFLSLWKVNDLKLDRQLYLLHLNYQSISEDKLDWEVPMLRNYFTQMVRALSPNHVCFPEPIDYFTCNNQMLPESLSKGEPVLIFAAPGGWKISPRKQFDFQKSKHILRKICLNTAYALRDLNNNGCLIRALPLRDLRRNPANDTIAIFSFYSLCRQQDFTGYNQFESSLNPSHTYAAPECFAHKGSLSPAADVYALARMLIEFIGEKLPSRIYEYDELKELCMRNGLNQVWMRFFNLSLHPNPESRFDGMNEVIRYINSDGDPMPYNRSHSGQASQDRSFHNLRLERGDAPSAALLVWDELTLQRTERLDYRKFVSHCQARYSLKPMLFFTKEQKDLNNNFFQFLRRLGFEIITFRKEQSVRQIISDLKARWQNVSNLVCIGSFNYEGLEEFLSTASQFKISAEVYTPEDIIPPNKTNVTQGDLKPFIEKRPATPSRQYTR